MTVSEYRDMMSGVSDAFASLRSAATPAEQVKEARRLEHQVACLRRAECPRAKFDDRAKAVRLADLAARYFEETGLQAELDRLRAEDALIARLAFAGDWR